MAIEPREYSDNYDEDISLINSMGKVFKGYQQSFDMVKAAEMHYERMRSLNKTTLIQVNITKSIGNILKSLSPESVFKNPEGYAIERALAEARSTILSRGVGPLEEIPVGDYIQDSIRAKNVITHTQIGTSEQKLIAKLMRERHYKLGGGLETTHSTYTEDVPAPGSHDARSYVNSILVEDANGNLSRRLEKDVPELHNASSEELSSARKFKNSETTRQYKPKAGTIDSHGMPIVEPYKNNHGESNPYSTGKAKELRPVSTETFDFAIKNLANGKLVSFPAHITSFNEGISTSWNNISLINRSEDIYVYQRAERSFNLEFMVFASTPEFEVDENGKGSDQLFPTTITIDGRDVGVLDKKMMWDRLNFLQQCARPEYTTTGRFNKAPYCLLYLGDVFHGITSIIDSINISYDPLLWDITTTNKFNGVTPMIAQVTLSGKLLHKRAPDSHYKFYGVIN